MRNMTANKDCKIYKGGGPDVMWEIVRMSLKNIRG